MPRIVGLSKKRSRCFSEGHLSASVDPATNLSAAPRERQFLYLLGREPYDMLFQHLWHRQQASKPFLKQARILAIQRRVVTLPPLNTSSAPKITRTFSTSKRPPSISTL